MTAPSSEMIPQLEAARQLVLGDAHIYTQILPGILPIIGPGAPLEVRRWGAEFFAESFASPSLGNDQKEELGVQVLPVLQKMLEIPGEDAAVVKAVVQTVASLYPLVFKRTISQPGDPTTWQIMTAIKSNILKRMDTAPIGVRICCIKFVQKVVQVQTPGVISDPRRPEKNETSIALVPRTHPLLPLPNLEAEASGLLDRLLNVFIENLSDPILIDATLNCLSILIRTRPPAANKIISAILNYNPLKLANTSMTPRIKVIVRSMERTTRALLRNVNKNNPNGPMAAKIDAHLSRLNQSRVAIFSDAPSLKRAATGEPAEGFGDAKRARIAGGPSKFPAMPPPPISYAQLWTLTEDPGLIAFDVKLIPSDMMNNIAALTLQHVDQGALEEALGAVRARYDHLRKMMQPTPIPDAPLAGPTGIDDEDDYDPEYDPEGTVDVATTSAAQALEEIEQPDIALGPFELPKPPPLTESEMALLSQQTVDRVFNVMTSLDFATHVNLRQKHGLNRLAASNNDRDAWITMMTRLATRAPSGLDELVASDGESDDDDEMSVKAEGGASAVDRPSLANGIRQVLYLYVLEDFRSRINVAISWLNEEWYNDRLYPKSRHPDSSSYEALPNYYTWTYRLLEALLQYLDARDKNLLIRFLSEIPAIDAGILKRVQSLAKDPERIGMCIMAMQYLILMRPPARSLVIDAVEGIWREEEYKEAKEQAAKVLGKWRPDVLQERDEGVKKQDDDGGTLENGAGAKAEMNGINPDSGGLKPELVDPRKRALVSRSPSKPVTTTEAT